MDTFLELTMTCWIT